MWKPNASRLSYNLVVILLLLSKLFEGNLYQGIELHIIYFSLTDINIRTVIILFSIHLPSIHTPKSSSDEHLW